MYIPKTVTKTPHLIQTQTQYKAGLLYLLKIKSVTVHTMAK